MDGGAWWAAVHGVAKSRTQLSDFTFIYIYTHTHTHTSSIFFFFKGKNIEQSKHLPGHVYTCSISV